MNALRCERLFKSFDGIQAVDRVTLEFPISGITALIGPNGAGKTTLLNVMTGFLRPNAGRCFFGKREITYLAPHQIVRLGVARTFQELKLISQISALGNVMLARPSQSGERLLPALLRRGVAREEAANREEAMRLLRFVGLAAQADELAGELSYGQQKLLTLSCCLATDAGMLLLDEPVAGVAPQMVEQVLELFRRLREQGKLIIFIEHNMEAIREVANLVIMMDHGKIIAQGLPKDVLERPEIMEAYLG